MATDEARLIAALEANINGFTKNLEKAKRVADKEFGAVERRMQRTEQRFARGFKNFGGLNGPNIGTLIGRYTAWGLIIGTLTKAMQEKAKTDVDAAKAVKELERAWDAWTENAAVVLSPILSATGKLLQNIAAINKELLAGNVKGAWQKFAEATSVPITDPKDPRMSIVRALHGGMTRTGGIPFASAGNIEDSIKVTPSKLGAHATNDQLEKARRAAEDKAKIEEGIRQNSFDIQQHFLELETRAVEEAAKIEEGIRQHYFDVQQTLWEREADELADFHTRATAAWDEYYTHLAEMTEQSGNERLAFAQQFFGELAQLSYSSNEKLKQIGKAAAIITTTIDGIQAVQKALAAYPPPINFAMAAAVGAVAAANVAQIAAMEKGGRVTAGTPYIVGEKRPELFVPDSNGTIIPRVPSIADPKAGSVSGSSSGPITISIDARGAQIGVAEQIEAAMARTTKDIERRFPRLMVKAQRDNL